MIFYSMIIMGGQDGTQNSDKIPIKNARFHETFV